MKFISLFAGIGGFDLGFESVGMTCVVHAEIDKYASETLAKHWPNVPNYGDVRNVKKETIGAVDLVCGGFQCQDISVAGKRAGLAGERSGMWYEFHRIIEEFRPRWVVIENVPGLLSSSEGRDMGTIIAALAKLRYGHAYRVLDAQYFGVAQRRRRVFIVANSRDWHYPAKVLFEPESCERHTPPSRETRSQNPEHLERSTLARCVTTREGRRHDHTIDNYIVAEVAPTLDSSYCDKRYSNQQFFSQNGDGEPITINARQTPVTSIDKAQPLDTQGRFGQAVYWQNKQSAGEIRIQKGGTSPTLTKTMGTGGNNVPFVGVRRLTPLECERLQGFPDGWTEGQSETQRYKQLGNAVCVNVAEWIGKRIMELEK